MTLTAHMAIAAAVTKPFARLHPIAGFLIALASHYLSDAIPHWDYSLSAMTDKGTKEKSEWNADDARLFRTAIIRDLRNFSGDALVGAILVLALIRPSAPEQWWWAGIAIIGGALPDFLQGLYLSGMRFLAPLQRLHDRMHTKIKLGPYPAIGIPFQAAILLAACYGIV